MNRAFALPTLAQWAFALAAMSSTHYLIEMFKGRAMEYARGIGPKYLTPLRLVTRRQGQIRAGQKTPRKDQ